MKSKFLICCVLFFMMLLVNTSLFIEYPTQLTTNPYIQIEGSPSVNKDLINSVYSIAKNNNCEVYYADSKLTNNSTHTELSIYCNIKTKKYIENRNYITEGMHKSYFGNSINITYYQFDDIYELSENNIVNIYFYGDYNNIYQALYAIKSKHGLDYQNFQDYNIRNYVVTELIIIFLAVAVILVLINIYNNKFIKKEVAIRCINGQNIYKFIFRRIAYDISCILFSYFIMYIFLKKVAKQIPYNTPMLILILILILIEIVNKLLLLLKNPVLVLKGKDNLASILNMTYLLKIVVCTLCSIVIALTMITAYKSFKYKSQEEYYTAKKNYYFVYFGKSFFNIAPNLQNDFIKDVYFNNVDKMDIKIFSSFFDTKINKKNTTIYYANKNMLNDIKSEIKNINIQENKQYILIPSKLNYTEDDVKKILEFANKSCNNNVQVVYIKKSYRIIQADINEESFSKYIDDPILLLDTSYGINFTDNIASFNNKTLFKLDSANTNKFNNIYTKYNIKEPFRITNVYETYRKSVIKHDITLKTNFVILFIFLFFEFLISIYIVKLEYILNDIELAVKKVSGYSIWLRMKKVLCITALCNICSAILSIYLCYKLETKLLWYTLFAIFITFVLEVLLIVTKTIKFERTNIQKILKGGSL